MGSASGSPGGSSAPLLGGGTVVNLLAARGGAPAGPAHLSVSPSQAALTALTRCLASILTADAVAVHGLMPQSTPAGGTGRIAAPVLGIRFGERFLTGEQVGDAVLALRAERSSRLWKVDADGLAAVDARQPA